MSSPRLDVELPGASAEIDGPWGGRRERRLVLLLLGVLFPLARGDEPPPFIVIFNVEPGGRPLCRNLFRRGVGHALRGLRT
jgi:hypothetical protein